MQVKWLNVSERVLRVAILIFDIQQAMSVTVMDFCKHLSPQKVLKPDKNYYF